MNAQKEEREENRKPKEVMWIDDRKTRKEKHKIHQIDIVGKNNRKLVFGDKTEEGEIGQAFWRWREIIRHTQMHEKDWIRKIAQYTKMSYNLTKVKRCKDK